MTLPLDMLKRPVKVGDTILCKGYGSCSHDTFTTVLKTNPTTVTIKNSWSTWDKDPVTGKWSRQVHYGDKGKLQTRRYSEVLVVNELLPISEALAQEYVATHPEHFL